MTSVSDILAEYFSGIRFKRVNSQDVMVKGSSEYNVYICKLTIGKFGGLPYVLVFVPVSYFLDNTVLFDDVKDIFSSVSIRTGVYNYDIQPQRPAKNIRNDVSITASERTLEYTKYTCRSLDFDFLLIHDPRKNTKYQFRKNMSVVSAVECFDTIITRLEVREYPV